MADPGSDRSLENLPAGSFDCDAGEIARREGELLGTLAHELRTPLGSIRNAVEVMKLKGASEPELQWCQEVIARQLDHLIHLIDGLLDVSRIDRNRLEVRRSTVELTGVIQRAVETSRPLIEQFGHELILTLPTESLYLDADQERLSQVFMNLLDNAAKYTAPPGHIWLMALQVGDDVVVSVRDDGVGIAAEKLPSLFEMFHQGDGVEDPRQRGLAIGLSLVRKLVEMHGGSVTARSEGAGKGSEFAVRLPLVEAPQRRAGSANDNGPERSTSARRILVVDDDHDAATSLARLLCRAGHDTRTAYDGIEAIEVAELFRPEVVLLDIGLPKVNGYEICRQIREQPWGRDVVMVALTGWGQQRDRRLAQEAGFDHHIVKPVDYDVLIDLLADLKPAPSAAAV